MRYAFVLLMVMVIWADSPAKGTHSAEKSELEVPVVDVVPAVERLEHSLEALNKTLEDL